MKNKLNQIRERLIQLQDEALDDELIDEIGNAIIHIDAAHDRIVHLLEEEYEDEDEETDSYEDLEQCSPENDPD